KGDTCWLLRPFRASRGSSRTPGRCPGLTSHAPSGLLELAVGPDERGRLKLAAHARHYPTAFGLEKRAAFALKRARGSPSSMTWTSPVHSRDAGAVKPCFLATMVAVWCARTVAPSGSPLSLSRPEGISTAKIRAGLALIASMIRS